MSLSDFSVRRPIAMSCLIIALTILGVNAYRKMGLELMPSVDIPYITIITNIDLDHLDYYKNLEDYISAFQSIVDQTR